MGIKNYGKLLWLFLFAIVIVSCDNETPYYGDGHPSDLNLLYSNKTATQPNAGALEISYSGGAIYGKEVYFQLTDASTAKFKLFNVMPSEAETLVEGVKLTETESGYSFEGNAISEKGTTFSYAGSVIKGELSISLTNIRIPDNPLSRKGKWTMITPGYGKNEEGGTHYNLPAFLEWEATYEDGTLSNNLVFITALTKALIANMFYLFVEDLTFHADGNITATYAAGIDEEVNIAGLIFNYATPDMRKETTESPINLIKYFVDGEDVYILPDIDMIMSTVQANKSRTRSAKAENSSDNWLDNINIGGIDLSSIWQIYQQINEWGNTGIKFTLKENNKSGLDTYGNFNTYEGEYIFYLDGKEIKFLLPLLEYLPLLLGDFMDMEVPVIGRLGDMLEPILEDAAYSTHFQLGLFLSENE